MLLGRHPSAAPIIVGSAADIDLLAEAYARGAGGLLLLGAIATGLPGTTLSGVTNVELDPAEVVCTTRSAPSAARRDADLEILEPRDVPLGGLRAMTVRRTLPQKSRSLIGAWCFADHYGPQQVADTGGMTVAPHPHTGLQTVSWLFEGEIEHRDSVGSHAMVRPGELNLMTAGRGISHSEVSTPETTVLHGVQLWVALPDSGPRDGAGIRARAAGGGRRRRIALPGIHRFLAGHGVDGHRPLAAARGRTRAAAGNFGRPAAGARASSTACWSTPATSPWAGRRSAELDGLPADRHPFARADRGRRARAAGPVRRTAAERGNPDVVELHRPLARGGRRVPPAMAGRDRRLCGRRSRRRRSSAGSRAIPGNPLPAPEMPGAVRLQAAAGTQPTVIASSSREELRSHDRRVVVGLADRWLQRLDHRSQSAS